MRVTVLELPARWGDPLGALADVDVELARGPETDLVLLPEASLAGYVSPEGDFDAGIHGEPIDGPTATLARDIARRRRTNLVVPLPLREHGPRISNAMIAFAPDGELLFTYRKRHPWIPERWATPGSTAPPVVPIRDMTVTICICYDVHFVDEDMRDELAAADLLLFPSAWVELSPSDSRDDLLVDLARRHRVAVANANWSPGVVGISGQGGSRVIDPSGRQLVRVAPHRTPAIHRIDATLELPSRTV